MSKDSALPLSPKSPRQSFPARQKVPGRFEVRFDLFPEGHFGVPSQDGTQLIVPEGCSTVPEELEKQLHLQTSVGGFDASLKSNHLSVYVESADVEDAYLKAEKATSRFLRFLSMNYGPRFEYRFRGAHSPDGHGMTGIEPQGIRQVFFHPNEIAKAIDHASTLSCSSDADLDRALGYFDHAMLLLDVGNRLNSGFPKSFWEVEHDYQEWLKDIILYLWKAECQILGEGKHRVKQMTSLGLDADLRTCLDDLAEIRNKSGVAHTHQEKSDGVDLRPVMDRGRTAVKKLLMIYSTRLAGGENPGHTTVNSSDLPAQSG